MSDHELEKIRQRKAEMLLKMQSMPKDIINIQNDNQFNELLKEFPDKIVVLDFWAVWCAPCKMYDPIFKKLNQEYNHDFIFAKINVDENPLMAQYFGISSIPSTVFVKGDKMLRKFVGVMNYETLKQIFEKFKS